MHGVKALRFNPGKLNPSHRSNQKPFPLDALYHGTDKPPLDSVRLDNG